MFVEILLAALALAAAGSTVAAIRRRRLTTTTPSPALPAARQLEQGEVVPDDVVAHLGVDYLVQGVTTLSEGDQTVLVVGWLDGGSDQKALVIDLDEEPRFVLGTSEESDQIVGSLPNWLQADGVDLRVARRATVRCGCQGRCPDALPQHGACEFGIYRGPGHRTALALLLGGSDLVFVGRAVAEAGLVLMPGGSARAERDAAGT